MVVPLFIRCVKIHIFTDLFVHKIDIDDRIIVSYGTSAVSVHPGVIATELSRDVSMLKFIPLLIFAPLILKSTSQGIATSLRCCTLTENEINKYNGEYFADCQPWLENKKIRKPLLPVIGGNRLRKNHDPDFNDKVDDICERFYDWTVEKIKETGAKMQL